MRLSVGGVKTGPRGSGGGRISARGSIAVAASVTVKSPSHSRNCTLPWENCTLAIVKADYLGLKS